MTRNPVEGVSEWVRKRIQMTLIFLDWLAETARLDAGTMNELERLYPGLSRYAALGQPLRDCSPEELAQIAGQPALLLDETDLTGYVKAGRAATLPVGEVEKCLLAAWLGGRRIR